MFRSSQKFFVELMCKNYITFITHVMNFIKDNPGNFPHNLPKRRKKVIYTYS